MTTSSGTLGNAEIDKRKDAKADLSLWMSASSDAFPRTAQSPSMTLTHLVTGL
jgi:hypothetical protein